MDRLQDILQAGDIAPNILGLMSGHIYYYFSEINHRLLLPEAPKLAEVIDALLTGKALITIPEEEEEKVGKKEEGGEGESEGEGKGEDDEDAEDEKTEDEKDDEEVTAAAPAA